MNKSLGNGIDEYFNLLARIHRDLLNAGYVPQEQEIELEQAG